MKKFGYKFWKDTCEVFSYVFVGLALVPNHIITGYYSIIIGLVCVCFAYIMMIVSEWSDQE